jgi:tetratricopeptide (TPR) repeat protein
LLANEPEDGTADDQPLSPYELVDRVTDLNAQLWDDELDATAAACRLEALWAGTPAEWQNRGDVTHAIASVYLQLGNHAKAIEFLEKAAQCSDVPLGTIEQLANTQARFAQRGTDRNTNELLFRQSIQRLCGLLVIRSSERWSLLGATLRRRADSLIQPQMALQIPAVALDISDPLRWYLQVTNDNLNDPGWLVGAARDAYAAAAAMQPEPADLYFPVSVSLGLALVTRPDALLEEALVQNARQSASKNVEQGEPWGAISLVDLDMLVAGFELRSRGQSVSADETQAQDARIAQAYTETFTFYRVTQSHRDSVTDNLKTLGGLAQATGIGVVADYLNAIRALLIGELT